MKIKYSAENDYGNMWTVWRINTLGQGYGVTTYAHEFQAKQVADFLNAFVPYETEMGTDDG